MLQYCIELIENEDFYNISEGHSLDYKNIIKNALIESALMHFRNLYDFYKVQKPIRENNDDISIKEFDSNFQHLDFDNVSLDALKNLYRKTNKGVAHLTFDRTSEGASKYDFRPAMLILEAHYSWRSSIEPLIELPDTSALNFASGSTGAVPNVIVKGNASRKRE